MAVGGDGRSFCSLLVTYDLSAGKFDDVLYLVFRQFAVFVAVFVLAAGVKFFGLSEPSSIRLVH